MSKCVDILDKPKKPKDACSIDRFAVNVSTQLSSLDQRRRLLDKKRINDILFELRYEDFVTDIASTQLLNSVAPRVTFTPGSYATLLQQATNNKTWNNQ